MFHSYGNGLIRRDAARQRQCPTGQMSAILIQVAFHRVGKMATQNRNDLRVSSGLGAKPAQSPHARAHVAGDVVPASLGNRLLTRNPVVAYSICQCTKT